MTAQANNEKELLRAIQSGRFRDRFLIYTRKSTDEPDNQKNSISYQKAENQKCAAREGLRVAPITLAGFCQNGIVSERHSGFKEDNDIAVSRDGRVQFRIERPKFHNLVRYLSLGLFRGVICLCWDRMSRNKADDAIVRKLMRKGIDVRFVFAKYDQSSAGALHMDIDGMFAEHHSRVTSEKVRTATRNLRDRGICTYRAPLGYLNTGSMEEKPFDPVRAPIIRRLFEQYVKGGWSLMDLARWANAQGLTTQPMRRRRTETELLAEEEDEVTIDAVSRPMTTNMIHKILGNPFYTGRVLGNDGRYVPSASHQPLISAEVFTRVQEVLKSKKVSIHYTDKLDLPYRGLVRCASCGRSYTPYVQKGIEYFSARCRPGCDNPRKNIDLRFLEGEIGKLLSTLHFTAAELERIEAQAQTDLAVFEEKRYQRLEENERRKKKLREDLTFLISHKLELLKSGVYTADALRDEETRLAADLDDSREAEAISDSAMLATLHDVVTLSELLKTAAGYHFYAKTPEKEEIARTVFSELFVRENTLSYKAKTGFKPFENRLRALGDPIGWLSEMVIERLDIQNCIEALRAWQPDRPK